MSEEVKAGESCIVERVEIKDRLPKSWKYKVRFLRLANGLQVVLSSDPEAEDCSASMRVNCGYFNDPDDIPGIAHFCEHMLFLGTEKYPEEGDYNEYMSAHGGTENAATGSETTYFFFTVNPSGFEGALDRFSQFFISPLFTESGTERELNAIESEHRKNIVSDGRRAGAVLKSICNQSHPFSKFATGNRETLTSKPIDEVRAALLRHFNTYFTPKNMFLSLESSLSLEEMERLVVENFAAIPERAGFDGHGGAAPCVKGTPVLPYPVDADGHSRLLVRYVPLDEEQSISITWGIPGGPRERWRYSPGHYISHLLGHESGGSVLSLLKSLGWAVALCAGRDSSYRSFETFSCTVQLTEEGFKHWEDVITIVYAYIGMLRSQEPSKRHFEELQIVEDLKYEYAPRRRTVDDVNMFTSFLSEGHDLDTFVTSEFLMFDFSPEKIKEVLECLTPDRTVVMISSQANESVCKETEKWYGVQYCPSVSPSAAQQEIWMAAYNHDFSKPCMEPLKLDKLHMPDINPFVPSRDGCKILAPQDEEADATVPERAYDDEQSTCFWKQDKTFGSPKVIGKILLANNRARKTARDYCCATYFCEVFSHYINEFTYMAQMADTHSTLSTNSRGLILTFVGFSEKIDVIIKKFLEELRDFVPPEPLFNIVKERLLEQAASSRNMPAYNTVMDVMDFYSVCYGVFSPYVVEEEFQKITIADLIEWQKNFCKTGVKIVSFFQGNLVKEKAIELTKLVASTMSMPVVRQEDIIQNDSCQIPPGLTTIDIQRSGEDENNGVLWALNSKIHPGAYTVDTIYASLLAMFLKPLFFNELRTKQQLGYVVFILCSTGLHVDSLQFLVQSDTHDPEQITSSIEAFRATIPSLVDQISEEEFRGFVDTYITRISIKDKSMEQNANQYWGAVITGELEFAPEKKKIALAKTCTRDGLIAFAKQYFPPDVPDKHECLIRLWGKFKDQADADAAGKKITLVDTKDILTSNPFPIAYHSPHKVLQPVH